MSKPMITQSASPETFFSGFGWKSRASMEYVQASEETSGGARLSVTEPGIDFGVLEGVFALRGIGSASVNLYALLP